MLHHRQQLDVRVAHLLYIFRDHRSKLAIIVKITVLRLSPGGKMHLIDCHRLLLGICLFPLLHPSVVCPLKLRKIRNDGRRLRAELRRVCVGICLQIGDVSLRLDLVFIHFSDADTRYKKLKNTAVPEPSHGKASAVPEVKIPHQADAHGIRCPHSKVNALHALHRHRVRAHFFINIVADAGIEARGFLLRQHRLKCVWINIFQGSPIVKDHIQCILRNLFSRNQHRKKTGLVFHRHLIRFLFSGNLNNDALRCRDKCLDQHSVVRQMRSEDRVRIVLLRICQRLDLCPVHQIIQLVLSHNTLLQVIIIYFPIYSVFFSYIIKYSQSFFNSYFIKIPLNQISRLLCSLV